MTASPHRVGAWRLICTLVVLAIIKSIRHVSFVVFMFREGQGRRVEKPTAAIPFPPIPQPENYTITYRTPVPCSFCGRAPEHNLAAVNTTVRRFSTRGPEPKRRER